MSSQPRNTRRSAIRTLHKWISEFGIDPLRTVSAIRNLPVTIREFQLLKAQNKSDDRWKLEFRNPALHDRQAAGGTASGHYFHQDLLVARKIYERSPERHVDVGSRLDGFVAHVAVFREIVVLDIRPSHSAVRNIRFLQKDATQLDPALVDYCDSLSSLHALEHFGLGRYGDPIDVDGYIKGFEVLTSMLKPNGILYLSVPIGRERIEFNGHRVFSTRRILDLSSPSFELIGFSYVDDAGNLHETDGSNENALGVDKELEYGCGIFELRKLVSASDPYDL
jgi:hypothetical protein